MAENFDVFSFELSEQDMNEIAKLDKAQSLFFSHYDPELVRFHIEPREKQINKAYTKRGVIRYGSRLFYITLL